MKLKKFLKINWIKTGVFCTTVKKIEQINDNKHNEKKKKKKKKYKSKKN